MTKTYLGDGVYAAPGNYLGEIVLTTENGIEATNTIILEPEVAKLLSNYILSILSKIEE